MVPLPERLFSDSTARPSSEAISEPETPAGRAVGAVTVKEPSLFWVSVAGLGGGRNIDGQRLGRMAACTHVVDAVGAQAVGTPGKVQVQGGRTLLERTAGAPTAYGALLLVGSVTLMTATGLRPPPCRRR